MSKQRTPKPARYNPVIDLPHNDPRIRGVRMFNKMIVETDVSSDGFVKDMIRYDFERRQWLEVKPLIDLGRCPSPHSSQRKMQILIDSEGSAVHDFHYCLYHGMRLDVSKLEHPQLVRSFANAILRMVHADEATKFIGNIRSETLYHDVLVECLTHHKGMHPAVTDRLVELVKDGTLANPSKYGIRNGDRIMMIDEIPWFDPNKVVREVRPEQPARSRMNARLAAGMIGMAAGIGHIGSN